uniref:Ig-like domain-containing protein n=1 Tax=Canis lupus familiaris TaxID=9615 RepID=A0A8C0T5Z8_CANLF
MKRHWDALLGLLWVHVCLVTGMKVEQSPSALSLQEGASSILKCNYSSAVNSVQWFRQNPGGGSLTRLNCTLNAKERFSTLHVAASQLEDSATYLCAVEAQCSLVICSLPPNCRWACSTSTSRGGHLPPQQPVQFYNFSFLLQYFFPPNIRCISAVVSLTFLALFLSRKIICR